MLRVLKSIRRKYYRLVCAKTVKINGVKISCREKDTHEEIRKLLFQHSYEDTERNILLRVLQPGMRVVEIGAGIGFIGLLASRTVGAKNVFCYEANVELEPTIRRNYALNDTYPELTMKAVTVDGTPVTFFRSDNIISSSLYDRARNDAKIVVDSVAFSEVLVEHEPDILIMDVEGAEVDLLAEVMPTSLRHLIVEMHPHIVGQAKIDELFADLAKRGYNIAERDRKTVHFTR